MADGSVSSCQRRGAQEWCPLLRCAQVCLRGTPADLKVPMLMMGYYNSFLAAASRETKRLQRLAWMGSSSWTYLLKEGWRVMSPAAARNNLGLVRSPRRRWARAHQAGSNGEAIYPWHGVRCFAAGYDGHARPEASEVKKARLAECRSVVESLRDAAVECGAKRSCPSSSTLASAASMSRSLARSRTVAWWARKSWLRLGAEASRPRARSCSSSVAAP